MTSKCTVIILLVAIQCSLSWAYDGKVHREISISGVNFSLLDSLLRGQLGIANGVNAKLVKVTVGGDAVELIWQWIAFGGEAEDYGIESKDDYGSTRGFNHFHDPLKKWDQAQLDHAINSVYSGAYCEFPIPGVECPWPVSALLWGLEPGMQDFEWNRQYPDKDRQGPSDWSWENARTYYYLALTSKTVDERNQNFADCFRALGQVMHLLQDMSVPLHTRNDVHIFPNDSLTEWPRKFTYEAYVNKVYLDKYFKNVVPISPPSRLLEVPFIVADPDHPNMIPLGGLFDRNAYNEGGPIPPADSLGLAEYSNGNFLTLDTMWTYQHPAPSDTTHESIDWLHPEAVVAENGKTYNRLYIGFKDGVGDGIRHLAAVDYFAKEYLIDLPFVEENGFTLDHVCWKDYADKLVPRAVGYSAALLDYFFRGELSVKATPVFGNGAMTGLKTQVRNITASEEAISNGEIVLTCIFNDSTNGEERSVTAPTLELTEPIGFGDEVEREFTLREPIPVIDFGSIKCMLAFGGKLGNEEGAVIGKYVPLNKFDEEWDNGLYGNYAWVHTAASSPPSDGVIYNDTDVVGDPAIDRLVKDNVRSEGCSDARINESYFLFEDAQNPDGLFISPNTRVQFKIDALSINAYPPAPAGEITNLQALILTFNNGLQVQFSQNGQFMDLDRMTVSRTFPVRAAVDLGIYQLFQEAGIPIAEPLYLEYINFIQQLYFLEGPSPEEHHQHMEVDYIRIVEPQN